MTQIKNVIFLEAVVEAFPGRKDRSGVGERDSQFGAGVVCESCKIDDALDTVKCRLGIVLGEHFFLMQSVESGLHVFVPSNGIQS